MLLQGFDELSHVAFSQVSAHLELLADFVDNRGFGGPGHKKLKESRADEIEVEHPSLPDIQDNCAIRAVRAADAL